MTTCTIMDCHHLRAADRVACRKRQIAARLTALDAREQLLREERIDLLVEQARAEERYEKGVTDE